MSVKKKMAFFRTKTYGTFRDVCTLIKRVVRCVHFNNLKTTSKHPNSPTNSHPFVYAAIVFLFFMFFFNATCNEWSQSCTHGKVFNAKICLNVIRYMINGTLYSSAESRSTTHTLRGDPIQFDQAHL